MLTLRTVSQHVSICVIQLLEPEMVSFINFPSVIESIWHHGNEDKLQFRLQYCNTKGAVSSSKSVTFRHFRQQPKGAHYLEIYIATRV